MQKSNGKQFRRRLFAKICQILAWLRRAPNPAAARKYVLKTVLGVGWALRLDKQNVGKGVPYWVETAVKFQSHNVLPWHGLMREGQTA